MLCYAIAGYLPNDGSVVTHSISCNTRQWFHSPDGSTYRLLNHSSSKYVISGSNLLLNLANVSGSDEGLYGCITSEGNRVNLLCVQVYGT